MVRQKTVAVAVIYDKSADGYLLWNNPRWRAYAFPMKRFDPDACVSPEIVALQAVQEVLPLPGATAEPLDRVGSSLFSEGVHEYTFYDYLVYGIHPVSAITPGALQPDLKFFTFEELQKGFHVSESTKLIARSLVEDRRVAVAVIHRTIGGQNEFLLIRNPKLKYFLPAVRLKTNLNPAEAAVAAVRNDLGYDGKIDIVDQAEAPAVQTSNRFGQRSASFYFHCCAVALPDVNCGAPGNPLENALTLKGSTQPPSAPSVKATYWGWFNEEQLRYRREMSPSVESILGTVLQLAERNK
jgi:hypothetical protein